MNSANSREMILVREVTKVYPGGVVANDAISLEVRNGEIVGILGPNGAGKTTLIRQILGLLKPTSGKIIVKVPDHTATRSRERCLIAYVPQAPLCYPSLTVWETLAFVLRLHGVRGKALTTQINKTLVTLGMEEWQSRFGYQLSMGARKLVLLAMALCQNRPILILDEPTSMVDVVKKTVIWEAIQAQRNKGCVLIASHDISEVRRVCDRVYLIVAGRVVASGAPHEIAGLLRLPVDIELAVSDLSRARHVIEGLGYFAQQQGDLLRCEAHSLEDSLRLVEAVAAVGGVDYVKLEGPSFEKAVMHLLSRGKDAQNRNRNLL